MTKIPVWQMIHEAVNAMTKEVFSVDDIRSYIFEHFGVVNNGTIGTQAYACTVNRQGRVNAPENKKPRIADGKLDFLYTVGRGLFTRFDPDTHGIWEITEQDGKLMVQRVDGQTTPAKLSVSYESRSNTVKTKASKRVDIESPNREAVLRYNQAWNSLEGYTAQESALNKLFREFCPENKQLDDVLLKVTALNAFYSTNIFSIYAVAKHILSLDIDNRLYKGDISLVSDIASGHGVKGSRNGKEKYFYSFATKYCSHHQPELFPIFDSYVEKLLIHLRDKDQFTDFCQNDLRNSSKYKDIILALCDFYSIDDFTLKEIDRYLWQYGKEKF